MLLLRQILNKRVISATGITTPQLAECILTKGEAVPNPFSFSGRLGRFHYFGYFIVFGIIFMVAFYIIAALLTQGPNVDEAALSGLSLLLGLGFFVVTMSLGVRRLHDFDKSGWWYLLAFVPFANVVFALILLFAPGTDGENSYGFR